MNWKQIKDDNDLPCTGMDVIVSFTNGDVAVGERVEDNIWNFDFNEGYENYTGKINAWMHLPYAFKTE